MCEVRKEISHDFTIMDTEQVKEVIHDITHCTITDPEDTTMVISDQDLGGCNYFGEAEIVLDEVHNKIIIKDTNDGEEVMDDTIDKFTKRLEKKIDQYVKDNNLLD